MGKSLKFSPGLVRDVAWSMLPGAGVACLAWRLPPPADASIYRDLLTACVSLGGIVVGFLATATALLITISDSASAMKWIVTNKKMGELVDRLFAAIGIGGILAGVAAGALVLEFAVLGTLEKIAVSTVAALLTATFISVFRLLRLLMTILKQSYG